MSAEIERMRADWPARLWDWLDVPEFGRWFEGRRSWSRDEWQMRIEEELTDDTMVLRAELPGIDRTRTSRSPSATAS